MATSIDRLVRKEVSLGAIREMTPPTEHIGLELFAPWLDVDTDDVIFDIIADSAQEGLAPARAEDAEAELAQKDELFAGEGRASLIDWAVKDKYSASDVTRYREDLLVQQATQGVLSDLSFNYSRRHAQEFQSQVARDDARRRRKLDNRIEWLIMRSIEDGQIAYNDGKIRFSVNWGRPADQQDVEPEGGIFGTEDSDPIGALLKVQEEHFDKYGVKLDRALISSKVANSFWKSKRFLAAVGMPIVGGTPSTPLDPNYLGLSGYNPEGALRIVEQVTGITFRVSDGIYRTRPIGGKTVTNNRFFSDDRMILWPSTLGEIDDTRIGFGKTLTSPHPEGMWASGFYEWEDETKDPWMHVRGSGVKAFPVFPYLEYTVTLKVL